MTIFVVLVVAIAAFLVYVSNRPGLFRLERSTIIPAPATSIQPMIEDFRQWMKWSPWEGLDPNLVRDYQGAPSGTGAIYSWSGNGKAGAGRMTIQSSDGQTIVLALEFLRPFKATNRTTFRLSPESTGTRVTWIMEGENGFMMKIFSMVFNFEKVVGKDFEKGLASLAEVVTSTKN